MGQAASPEPSPAPATAVPITCPVGAIPDVMKDGVHGLFVPPRDPSALAAAIRRLHDDRTLLATFGEASRRRILEHYTVARLANDFTSIYKGL